MENKRLFIEFFSSGLYIKLLWSSCEASEDMVIDAIDGLGKHFLEHFESTYLNFLNSEGRIVCIDFIVSKLVTPVFVRGPDGSKNQNLVSENEVFSIKQTGTKKIFKLKNCELIQSKKYLKIKDKKESLCILEGKQGDTKERIEQKLEAKIDYKIEDKKVRKIEENKIKEYELDEISKHNKKNDCWIVIYNKVYNITSYINQHPGGNIILNAAGRDATSLFNRYHSWINENLYKMYFIGHLKSSK